MKTEKNILVAFLLNLSFAIFELVGGIFTGSVAIISDAIHDVGDALSIGIAFFLEKKSKRPPNEKYTYGYARYSVIGSVITTLILLLGSVMVVYNAILRIINPTEINYNGMIIFAVIGVTVNLVAALLTHKGDSLNQKAVSLHMLEDVLGWVVVLVGAIVMRFTDFYILDPLMSIGVSVFIFVSAVKGLKEAVELFLEKTPRGISLDEIKEHILKIDGVLGVHHIHVWSMDGQSGYATMHIVSAKQGSELKAKIREELKEHGIAHATLEIEDEDENCQEMECQVEVHSHSHHHHHH
ncbi:MAG: cation transporter [Clostridia bacterium]|nr:cation transporter [Clostridia bacterium]